MIRFLAAAIVAIALLSVAFVRVSSAPADDPKVNARAKEWLERAQKGDYDRSQFTNDMSAAMTDTAASTAKSSLDALGPPLAFTLRARYEVDGNTVYVYRVTFKDAAWNEQISFAGDGKISGLYFRPAPAPSETALPGENAGVAAKVKAEFLAWQRGQIDRTRYAPAASEAFNEALVSKVAAELTAFGTPNSFVYRGKIATGGGTIYAYHVSCVNSDVWMTIGFDAASKITGIAFQPE
jgi:hypothetical protein